MKIVSSLVKSIETKSEHDLVKAIIRLVVGFAVAKVIENAYDSAVASADEDTASTN